MRFKVTTTFDDNYMISLDEGGTNKYPISYNVVCARMLGFSYPDFLLYCKANGATLRGRDGYCHPVFKNINDCQKICQLVNSGLKYFDFLFEV